MDEGAGAAGQDQENHSAIPISSLAPPFYFPAPVTGPLDLQGDPRIKGAITVSCRLMPQKRPLATGSPSLWKLVTPQTAGKESGHLPRDLFRLSVHGDQEVRWGRGFH